MITNVLNKENIASTIHDVPAVSIIMPFEAVMSTKSKLELRLKKAAKIVELEIMKQFTIEQALPVIVKLQLLLREINYNTQKKGLAIFVSPLVERVFYLDFDVEEKVVVDELFEIRDLILNKKESIQYLLLLLSEERSKMYLGSGSELQLIKSNKSGDISTCKINIEERVPDISDPWNRKQVLLDKFLYNMDQGLSLILKAYNLPVIIMAPAEVLNHFNKISKNSEALVSFIHGNYTESTEKEIQITLQACLQDWKNLKQQKCMQEVAKAMNDYKLSFGIQNVWLTANHKNCRLLVVEKDFVYPAYFSKNNDEYNQYKAGTGTPFYIKDLVDEVIEKVVKNGGDVEFVDELKNYDHIALLEYN